MKRLFLLLVLFSVPLLGEEKLEIHLFWSKDCEYCHDIMENFLPPLLEKYRGKIELHQYEITENIENYRLLTKFEQESGTENSPIPVIFVRNIALGGADRIKSELPGIIESFLKKSKVEPQNQRVEEKKTEPVESTVAQAQEDKAVHQVYLVFFYKPGCSHCDRLSVHLDFLKKIYPTLQIRSINIEEKENKILNEALCERLGVPAEKHLVAPSVFFDDTAMVGEGINLSRLTAIVESKIKTGNSPPWEILSESELAKAKENIKSRFRTFSPFVVIGAGLLDGINPCAFATIAFFVVFLRAIGRKQKEVLLVGLSFALAVFTTYFVLGLGFLNFLKALAVVKILAKIIYAIGAIAAIIFGILNFYDFFKARKGEFKGIILQLPEPIKRRIHRTIMEKNESRRHRNYVIMASVTGFLISLLELACTGQVYLPTLVYVLSDSTLRLRAVFYLLLYNLMFIVPLLAVFGLFLWGTSSEKINLFVARSTATVKLLTSILFLVLGAFLIRTII